MNNLNLKVQLVIVTSQCILVCEKTIEPRITGSDSEALLLISEKPVEISSNSGMWFDLLSETISIFIWYLFIVISQIQKSSPHFHPHYIPQNNRITEKTQR